MSFRSYSQAGQDCFAFGMNGGKVGMFLDIGCGHPTSCNNSYGLERIGWVGVCVDIHRDAAWDSGLRTAKLVIGDATLPLTFKPWGYQTYDYISIDCDEKSLAALKAILDQQITARCITIEHDSYRLGSEMRDLQRGWLKSYGYVLARRDVIWEGDKAFEDWWIKPL